MRAAEREKKSFYGGGCGGVSALESTCAFVSTHKLKPHLSLKIENKENMLLRDVKMFAATQKMHVKPTNYALLGQ